MSSTSTLPASSAIPTVSASTVGAATRINLNYSPSEISKGSGSIFLTDGAVQTVIDRVTGQPKLRVVGATFSKEIPVDDVSISGTHVSFDATGLPPGAKLNVYMGAGTLTSAGKAAPAITVPDKASFTVPDAGLPTGLTASITLDGNSLKSGEELFVEIKFNKAVATLSPSAVTAGNAEISGLTSYDDGITWVARLTGLASTDAPSNVLRVNMDMVTAADGTHGSGVATSASYLVDTLVAAYVGPSIDLVEDAGPSQYDGVSNDDTMAVSGLLHGNLKSGESIELVINGRTIDASKIQISSTYSSGIYKWSYSNSAEHFELDTNSVQVRVVGPGGHSSQTATKSIVIDQDAPDVLARPTAPVAKTDAIEIKFDERMYWENNVEVTHDIRVVDALGNTSWIDLAEDMLSEDGKTLTLSAADHRFASGNSYSIYLPHQLTDQAGNRYTGPAINVTTSGPYEDKAPPRLFQAYVFEGKELYGKGEVIEFRLRYSEKVSLADGSTPVLNLTNDGVATYLGLSADGKEMRFSYTVEAGDDIASLDLYKPWSLEGDVRDLAGNAMQNVHIEFDELTMENGYGATIEIDTVAAKPGAPGLHAASDTGAVGDGITANTTPRLTGSGAEPGATISLWIGDEQIGSANVGDDGRWDTTITTTLSVGAYQIKATQEDRAGNVSELSDALNLTIVATTTPPSGLSAPVLDPLSDSGISDSDRLTTDDTPAISGKGPASTALTLMLDGADLTTVTTNASGDWHYVPATPLSSGSHSFSVRQGSGTASPALTVTIDKSHPSVTASPDGASAFNPAADIVITFSEAVHIAPSEGDEDMLVLRDTDDNVRKIAVSDAQLSSDKRSLTISAAQHRLLGMKDYRIDLPSTLTDLAGNSMGEYQIYFRTASDGLPTVTRVLHSGDHYGRAGETITFTLRFSETVVKVGTDPLSIGLSNGASASFVSVSGNEAVFSYTVEAGRDIDDLEVSGTSSLVGRFADTSGNLLDAAHIQFDGLYDSGGYGSWLEIDTVAPPKPDLPLLAPHSDSAYIGDRRTNDSTPTLTGTGAEPWAKIEIYEGGTLLGSDYADEDGAWQASVPAGKALLDGEHQLSIVQVDAAGNRSVASDALIVTVDTVAGVLSVPRLADGADTGASAADRVTSNVRPELVGTGGAEPGATIRIFENDVLVGTGYGNEDGSWSATLLADLTDGTYTFVARQLDAAGNLSLASDPLVITVDHTPPTAAAPAPDLDAGSDSGASNTDNITNDSTPTFRGTGALANSEVALIVGTSEVGRVTADASGNWSITSSTLANGTHQVRVRQFDLAGNQAPDSDPLSVTIDTAGPTAGSFMVNLSARKFSLPFSENIVFTPGGSFKLLEGSIERESYWGSNSSSWNITANSGGDMAVLNFNISLNGLLKMQWTNGSVTDIAGNLAVITGTPEWEFTMS